MSELRNPTETRRSLLRAAFRTIYRKGYHATTIDDILAQTGVTKGALYHHFPTKLELAYAMVDEELTEGLRRVWLEPVRESGRDPVGILVEAIRAAFAGVADEEIALGCPVANLALEMSPVDEGFRGRINRLYELWRSAFGDMLLEGQRRAVVRKDIDPAAAAAFIVASIAGCRTVAKNAQSREMMNACCASLCAYIETLRA